MKTTKIQYSQIKQIFGVLPEELKKDKEMRQGFILDFTNGRTASTRELSSDEADNLIAALKGNYSHFGKFDKNNSQHLAALNLCYDLGWTIFDKRLNRNVADLEILGTFIVSKKSPVRKPLLEMTAKECSKLITALEGILKSNYKK
jgi:hypothetical protein